MLEGQHRRVNEWKSDSTGQREGIYCVRAR